MTAEPVRNVSTTAAPANPGLERALKIVVVVLALMIFAGLGAVIWRIMQLASSPPGAKTPVSPAAATLAPPAVPHAATAALPQGAAVRSVALDGDRIAIHYESPEGAGITIIEVTSGRTISNVRITQPSR